MMGLPAPVSESTWCDLKKRIHPVIKRAANIHLQEAAAHVYADTNLGMPDRDGVLDISVSIDGSWQKRGRTSKKWHCDSYRHHDRLDFGLCYIE